MQAKQLDKKAVVLSIFNFRSTLCSTPYDVINFVFEHDNDCRVYANIVGFK